MFVGEAPGAEEDRQGRPFVGASGKLLTRLLEGVGIDRSTVFITSIVKCRPPRNREPKPEEIAACHHYLVSQIKLIGPRVVSPLGRLAAQSLIDRKLQISQEHGKTRRIRDVVYFPMFHPAAALHRAGMTDQLEKDTEALRRAVRREVKGVSGEAENA
jgi:DNA polymerase